MTVLIEGELTTVDIPIADPKAPTAYRSGDYFFFNHPGNTNKVLASTLPMVPGMKIVQSKPVVWATASHAFLNYKKIDHQRGPNSVAKTIKDLLHRAQENLLREMIAVDCNAVLGMSINVTTDSSGEHGNSKIVIVTISGTPCSVMPMAKVPAVDVNNTVLPLYSPTNTELQH